MTILNAHGKAMKIARMDQRIARGRARRVPADTPPPENTNARLVRCVDWAGVFAWCQ